MKQNLFPILGQIIKFVFQTDRIISFQLSQRCIDQRACEWRLGKLRGFLMKGAAHKYHRTPRSELPDWSWRFSICLKYYLYGYQNLSCCALSRTLEPLGVFSGLSSVTCIFVILCNLSTVSAADRTENDNNNNCNHREDIHFLHLPNSCLKRMSKTLHWKKIQSFMWQDSRLWTATWFLRRLSLVVGRIIVNDSLIDGDGCILVRSKTTLSISAWASCKRKSQRFYTSKVIFGQPFVWVSFNLRNVNTLKLLWVCSTATSYKCLRRANDTVTRFDR